MSAYEKVGGNCFGGKKDLFLIGHFPYVICHFQTLRASGVSDMLQLVGVEKGISLDLEAISFQSSLPKLNDKLKHIGHT